MRKERLIVVSAPSGAGKTTLCSRLLNKYPCLSLSVSFTTRPPRKNEVDGRDYHFTTHEQFKAMVQAGEFAEWAEVHGNLYGTSKKKVVESLDAGLDVLFDIDWQGAVQLRRVFPEAFSVFIMPPSFEELERRLRGRETDPEEVILVRLRNAREEMEKLPLFEYVVVNGDLDIAFEQLDAIFIAEGLKVARRHVGDE